MAAHSEIGASGASRWWPCPGSVQLIRKHKLRKPHTIYTAEGTAAHELAYESITKDYDPQKRLGDTIMVHCDVKNVEWVIEVTQEMIDGVWLYRNALRTWFEKIQEWKEPTLVVADFKFGGTPVEVENNKQLLQYSVGAMLTRRTGYEVSFEMPEIHPLMYGTADAVLTNYNPKDKNPERVVLMVVQPRYDHPEGTVRTWEIDGVGLIEFAAELKKRAAATDDPEAPLVPGKPQCDFCPAAAICPALRKPVNELIASKVKDLAAMRAATISPTEKSHMLNIAEQAEIWAAAVREYVYEAANKGEEIPGWKLVQKIPRRKWADESDLAGVRMIFVSRGVISGDEIYEPKKVKSPPQIEELIKDTFKKEARKSALSDLEALVNRKSSGLTLVRSSDKREAVKQVTAQQMIRERIEQRKLLTNEPSNLDS